ncbi:MAG TPA: helix-turn-helix transcriptional regulator [Candidatus Limivivens intestinipullorum]|uniref:Helix-turn-helix transcriptional regulator n=1 Tax=Candidatus Limivivens intestinipullorum TaxID=2840858 RepID=A0A9D1EVK4_9FIRM|nr:helix-turn-helix transcriptional regulator [Candidatus Limivivens intestinipullorum]
MATIHLAQHLKELREANRYTQDYVSSQLNIERPTYSNYEIGKRMPPLDLLVDIADFYQISLDSLVRPEVMDSSAASAEKQSSCLTGDEIQLLTLYRSLSDPDRKELLDFARFKKSNHS